MNGAAVRQVLDGWPGQEQYCQHCQQQEGCDHTGPKILPSSELIMGYLFEERRGRLEFPWPGSWRDQAPWVIDLMQTGRDELTKLEREAADERN